MDQQITIGFKNCIDLAELMKKYDHSSGDYVTMQTGYDGNVYKEFSESLYRLVDSSVEDGRMIKTAIVLAIIGHILCGICDCLLSYTPKGRLNLKDIKDQDKMSAMFADMPLSFPLASMIMGTFAITLFGFGYFAALISCMKTHPFLSVFPLNSGVRTRFPIPGRVRTRPF